MPQRRNLAVGVILALGIWSLGIQGVEAQEDVRPSEGGALGAALDQLRSGAYEEALRALRELSRGASARPAAEKAYGRALMEVGRYEDALQGLLGAGGIARDPELENVLGEAHRQLGHLDEAEAAFRRAMESEAADMWVARLNLGVLLWDRGQRDQALNIFDSFIDLYNKSRTRLTGEDLLAVGTAVRYLGVTNPALYQDALMAFDDAAELDPDDPAPDILAGELFLEKYRATDARGSFKPVLDRNPRNPRALLGQARILDFEGVGGSVQMVRRALEVNPRYVDALTFLASLHLKTEDYSLARAEVEEALDINPNHLGALSVLAATFYLEGDRASYQEVVESVHALNPGYGEVYTTVAELAVAQRQYEMAVVLARQAVELDPTSWWSLGVLGMNQLRTGAVEEGRGNLERAFAGDPYNPWYKNTLDLLDTFGQYRETRTEHFRIFIHESESDLLGPYAGELAEEAFTALAHRYGAEPPIPIRLEIYPRHSDFSVRTLGIPGLGALGVSFGSTLVMDSPSAEDPGNFNWASTMWHEIAHAFHLSMSDHRVPRWFTEGLAVHEQHEARPYWGLQASPAWLQAYAGHRLQPVSRLDEGFLRPEYPQQVVLSYYQASLVFDLIESRWGLDAVLAMLEGYRQGKPNAQVFREVLGETPEGFDGIFDAYVESRWGDRIQAVTAAPAEEVAHLAMEGSADPEALRLAVARYPGSFQARLFYGQALYREGRLSEAEAELEEALRLFPEYGEADSPYWYLAQIQRDRGELEQAAGALEKLGDLGETLGAAHLEAARIRLQLGDTAAAARGLEKAAEIVPSDLEVQEQLANLYGSLGQPLPEVRCRRAILALNPVDRAGAHYHLAAALAAAGEPGEARTQVLRALEIAPTYDPALELLLKLRGGGGIEDDPDAPGVNRGSGSDSRRSP